MVPPFGWEDVASYRMRRAWAQRLARDGHPVVRLDLPGTGDSAGGPADPDLLGAWARSVADAAAWLRAGDGCDRIAAIGLGLGAVTAHLAAARGAPVDDLVLWPAPARVRSLVRELRAFAALAAAEWRDAEPPADAAGVPEGWLEVAGYVLSEETLSALSALDLSQVAPPPGPAPRRALLLGRDGAGPDERLAGALEAAGVEVTRREGAGWSDLTSGPQSSSFPSEAAAAVAGWLAAAPAGAGAAAPAPAAPAATSSLDLDGLAERPWELDGGRLFGILAQPPAAAAAGPADLGVVLLNAGAVRHTGPNRQWVELARAWAPQGVPVLRLDIEGIGDAGGEPCPYADSRALYDSRLSLQAIEAVRALAQQGVASSFVVGGLCAGASWAFHTLLADEPLVQAAILVNLFAFFYDDEMLGEADAAAARRSRDAGSLLRVLRGEVDPARVRGVAARMARTPLEARGRRRRGRERTARVDVAFDRIRDRGQRLHILLGIDEPAYAALERENRIERLPEWPNVSLQRLPTRDHTFRAVWLQRHVRGLLDEMLAAELAHARSPAQERA